MAEEPAHTSRQSKRAWYQADSLRTFYKHRWVAIPGFLLVFITGAIGSLRTVPVYEAQTRLIIEKDAYRVLQSRALAARTAKALESRRLERVPPDQSAAFSVSGLVAGGMSWLSSVVTPAPVIPSTADAASSESAVAAARINRVLGGLIVMPIPNSRLVDVRFRSPDAAFAADAANALVDQYVALSLEIRAARARETGAAGDYRGSDVQVIDRAEVPGRPVLPQTGRDLAVSAVAGLLLAIALAFGVEHVDSRIKAPDEIKAYLDLPFLGMIPTFSGGDESGEAPLSGADVPPAFAEAIRAVRAAVTFSSAAEGARSVVVTSTGPDEGKTLISSSLAIALAQAGQRTIVVDADMRRPRMHEAIGRPQEPGLSNVLAGEATLADAARSTSVQNLTLLAAGHIPPNPVELLCSPRYAALLAELEKRYDWVVIDAPPVMPVTDAAVVANTASGVIFVVGSEMTPRQNAAAAVEQLRRTDAKFVGAVLNRVNITRRSYYYSPSYRKSYGKYYQRSARRA